MTHKSSTPPRSSVDALMVEQLLELQSRASVLEAKLTKLKREEDRWEKSRWGRVQASLRRHPRASVAGKVRGLGNALLGRNPSSQPAEVTAKRSGPVRPDEPQPIESDRSGGSGWRCDDRFAESVVTGRRLTVAAVMDPFTRAAFEAECRIVDLHPESWQQELVETEPDLLFIESAWRGHRESWFDTVQHKPQELVDIVEWCRSRGVPTVFWNKEDPVYYDRYVEVAALFDHVFTTDIETIPRYVSDLGHQRVHVLPFAAQPLLCNPIQTEDRKSAAVFAGSYYPGFKQRNIDLFAQFDGVGRVMPVEIFDRNLNSPHDIFRWPSPYDELVVGTLAPDQIDVAYKGYQVALNVNTVTESQTMLARRAFDLLASGTPTISNFSRSIKVLFGDLVPASNDPDQIEILARQVVDDPDTTDKRRVMGVRHILRNHTYGARWRHVLATVSGAPVTRPLPRAGLVCLADSVADVSRWRELADAESQALVALVIVSDDSAVAAKCAEVGVTHVARSATDVAVADVFHEVDAVAHLSPEHWYGPFYLEGLLGALAYSDAPAAAKVTRFSAADGHASVVDPGQEFRRVDARVPWSRAMALATSLGGLRLAELIGGALPAELDVVGIDRFDFLEKGCAVRYPVAGLSATLPIHTGVTAEQLVLESGFAQATEIPATAYPAETGPSSGNEGCVVHPSQEGVLVGWSLRGKSNTYLPFRERLRVADIVNRDALYLCSRTAGDGYFGLNVSWYDRRGKRVPGYTYPADVTSRIEIPADAEHVALSLTLRGKGARLVRSITLSGHDAGVPQILSGWAAHALIVTNAYPAYGDFYRNGFVHTRVRGYREAGHDVTVFVARPKAETSYREYQGVNVITGSPAVLEQMLDTGHFHHVMVHFLDRFMWPALSKYRGQIPISVFVHGAEIQPYWRREFNYRTPAEREVAVARSEERMELWREVASSEPGHIEYIFVSRAFGDQAMADFRRLGFELPADSIRVISNPVDTRLFSYEEKDPEMRKNILLIRPFASRTYANDLAVAALLALSGESWFSELNVRIIGDGVLFEEDTVPLSGLSNVTVERRFLPQSEIAELHKQFGVFLVPTRQDTQGVSRDEAMSSGLVPVTSDIPVISEFLSSEEGYIAPSEDAMGLADAIRDLYYHPEVFVAKSQAAAARIRRTVASAIVIPQEVALFASGPPPGHGEGTR